MPGLNILINRKAHVGHERQTHKQDVIFHGSQITVSADKPFPHYPIQEIDTGEFFIAAEGYFFDWEDPKQQLEEFASEYFNSNRSTEIIQKWFDDTDADFLLFIYHKPSGSGVLLNDIQGRIPCYRTHDGDHTIFTRNPAFVSHFRKLKLNRLAGAEALTFGFTLGSHTIYEGVEKLSGGAIVNIDRDKLVESRYHQFNYEELIDENFLAEECITKCREIFISSLKNRSRYADQNIVLMSGGLDSRTVAAGFKLAKCPFHLVSYLDAEGLATKDLRYAKKIADHLEMGLKIVEISAPEESDFRSFFAEKYGLSMLDMTFFVSFINALSKTSQRPAIFTGDGGDKIFPNLKPIISRNSLSAIRNYILYQNGRMKPQKAAAILGLEPEAIRKRIDEVMNSYPEQDWNFKYVHFIMQNRVGNWLLEGEDRNRSHLNSFTPFYNLKLFKLLMSAPEAFKKDFFLYRKFLDSLNSAIAAIPNANWGFNIYERSKIKNIYLKEDLKATPFGQAVRSVVKRDRQNYMKELTNAEQKLWQELKSQSEIRQTFNLDKVGAIGGDNFHHLLTLMLATEQR